MQHRLFQLTDFQSIGTLLGSPRSGSSGTWTSAGSIATSGALRARSSRAKRSENRQVEAAFSARPANRNSV